MQYIVFLNLTFSQKATVGQLTVTDVRYSCTTKKLLLRLEDTVPRQVFLILSSMISIRTSFTQ